MKKGDKTDVIETKSGFAIFLANGDVASPDFTNADVIAAVQSYLTTYENSVIENFFIEKAKDFTNAVATSDFDVRQPV